MVIDEDLLEKLEALPTTAFEGLVYRHVVADREPITPNSQGARWNPPGVSALYTSIERATAVAEGDHVLAQPVPIRIRRTIYRIRVRLERVVDLRPPGLLAELGVEQVMLVSPDHWACQHVGEAVAHIGIEAILVPSARCDGSNLVVFLPDTRADVFEIVDWVVIFDPSGDR